MRRQALKRCTRRSREHGVVDRITRPHSVASEAHRDTRGADVWTAPHARAVHAGGTLARRMHEKRTIQHALLGAPHPPRAVRVRPRFARIRGAAAADRAGLGHRTARGAARRSTRRSDVCPRHPSHRYRLELHVDPSRPRFEGVTDITVDAGSPARRDLAPRQRSRRDARHRAARRVPAPGRALGSGVEERAWWRSGPSPPIGPGRVTVHVEYSAAFAKGDEGPRRQGAERAQPRVLAARGDVRAARIPQLRRASFKTPFEVVMHVPKGSTAISSAHEIAHAAETIADPAAPGNAPAPWERFAFAPTEKLPTYLGGLHGRPARRRGGARHPAQRGARAAAPAPRRGHARPRQGDDVRPRPHGRARGRAGGVFRHRVSVRQARHDRRPRTRAAPWRTRAPSPSPKRSCSSTRRARPSISGRLFSIVAAHEISHRWFGNLVTMQWWDDLWLNESFATWAETRIVTTVSPELSGRGRGAA